VIVGWIEAINDQPMADQCPTNEDSMAAPQHLLSSLLTELKAQTALLQALVSHSAATPNGGTVAQAPVKSVPGEAASKFTVKPEDFSVTRTAAAPKSAAYGLAAMEARELAPAPPELAPCITKQLWKEDDWVVFKPDAACVLTLADGTTRHCKATGKAGEWVQLRLGNHAYLAAPLSAVELEGQQQE
jgi:hypothetical protein